MVLLTAADASAADPAPLFEAIGKGDVEAVRTMVETDPGLLDSRDPAGVSPLVEAALAGETQVARVLIEAGADVKASGDRLAGKPLLRAAWNGDVKMVKLLLDEGAPVDGCDVGWSTPLMEAAHGGALDVVKVLVKAGAGLDRRDRDGLLPVCHAAAGRNQAVLKYFAKIGKLKNLKKDRIDWCALESAVTAGRYANVKLLLKKGADPGQALVDMASDPKIRALLEKHAKTKGKKAEEPGILGALMGSDTLAGSIDGAGVIAHVEGTYEPSPSEKKMGFVAAVEREVEGVSDQLSGCLHGKKKGKKAPWANLVLRLSAHGKLVGVRVSAGAGLHDGFEGCASQVLAPVDFPAPPGGAIMIPVTVDL